MKIRLYHYWRSSSSWRVRWALLYKNLKPEYVHVDIPSDEVEGPENRARNPFGTVPVIEFLDGPAHSQFLSESLPIIELLEELIPTPSLLSQNPFDRAKIRQLAEYINAGTQPLQNLNPQFYYSDDPALRKKWAQHWIRNGLSAYENLVTHTKGRFSFGDQLTTADLCLIPQCYNALRFEVPLEEFPQIAAIYQNCSVLLSYLASHPDQFQASVTRNFSQKS